MLTTFSDLLALLTAHLTPATVFVLMTMESTLFPVPSEAVMIPAGYLVSAGQMNPFVAFAAGVAGSVAGASINYVLGKYVGKAIILKYGRYLLVSAATFERSERLYLRGAVLFTFVGRLIPGVRHLISIPAGMFDMRFVPFVLATAAGSGLWVGVLMAIGYFLGNNAALVGAYLHQALVGLFAVAALAGGLWWLAKRRKARSGEASDAS